MRLVCVCRLSVSVGLVCVRVHACCVCVCGGHKGSAHVPLVMWVNYRYGKGDFACGTALVFLPGLPEILEVKDMLKSFSQ